MEISWIETIPIIGMYNGSPCSIVQNFVTVDAL